MNYLSKESNLRIQSMRNKLIQYLRCFLFVLIWVTSKKNSRNAEERRNKPIKIYFWLILSQWVGIPATPTIIWLSMFWFPFFWHKFLVRICSTSTTSWIVWVKFSIICTIFQNLWLRRRPMKVSFKWHLFNLHKKWRIKSAIQIT